MKKSKNEICFIEFQKDIYILKKFLKILITQKNSNAITFSKTSNIQMIKKVYIQRI